MNCKTCKHAIFDPLWGDYKCSEKQRCVTVFELHKGCKEYVEGTPKDSKETEGKDDV